MGFGENLLSIRQRKFHRHQFVVGKVDNSDHYIKLPFVENATALFDTKKRAGNVPNEHMQGIIKSTLSDLASEISEAAINVAGIPGNIEAKEAALEAVKQKASENFATAQALLQAAADAASQTVANFTHKAPISIINPNLDPENVQNWNNYFKSYEFIQSEWVRGYLKDRPEGTEERSISVDAPRVNIQAYTVNDRSWHSDYFKHLVATRVNSANGLRDFLKKLEFPEYKKNIAIASTNPEILRQCFTSIDNIRDLARELEVKIDPEKVFLQLTNDYFEYAGANTEAFSAFKRIYQQGTFVTDTLIPVLTGCLFPRKELEDIVGNPDFGLVGICENLQIEMRSPDEIKIMGKVAYQLSNPNDASAAVSLNAAATLSLTLKKDPATNLWSVKMGGYQFSGSKTFIDLMASEYPGENFGLQRRLLSEASFKDKFPGSLERYDKYVQRLLENEKDLSGLNLEGINFTKFDFSGKNLKGANLNNITFDAYTDFTGVTFDCEVEANDFKVKYVMGNGKALIINGLANFKQFVNLIKTDDWSLPQDQVLDENLKAALLDYDAQRQCHQFFTDNQNEYKTKLKAKLEEFNSQSLSLEKRNLFLHYTFQEIVRRIDEQKPDDFANTLLSEISNLFADSSETIRGVQDNFYRKSVDIIYQRINKNAQNLVAQFDKIDGEKYQYAKGVFAEKAVKEKSQLFPLSKKEKGKINFSKEPRETMGKINHPEYLARYRIAVQRERIAYDNSQDKPEDSLEKLDHLIARTEKKIAEYDVRLNLVLNDKHLKAKRLDAENILSFLRNARCKVIEVTPTEEKKLVSGNSPLLKLLSVNGVNNKLPRIDSTKTRRYKVTHGSFAGHEIGTELDHIHHDAKRFVDASFKSATDKAEKAYKDAKKTVEKDTQGVFNINPSSVHQHKLHKLRAELNKLIIEYTKRKIKGEEFGFLRKYGIREKNGAFSASAKLDVAQKLYNAIKESSGELSIDSEFVLGNMYSDTVSERMFSSLSDVYKEFNSCKSPTRKQAASHSRDSVHSCINDELNKIKDELNKIKLITKEDRDTDNEDENQEDISTAAKSKIHIDRLVYDMAESGNFVKAVNDGLTRCLPQQRGGLFGYSKGDDSPVQSFLTYLNTGSDVDKNERAKRIVIKLFRDSFDVSGNIIVNPKSPLCNILSRFQDEKHDINAQDNKEFGFILNPTGGNDFNTLTVAATLMYRQFQSGTGHTVSTREDSSRGSNDALSDEGRLPSPENSTR